MPDCLFCKIIAGEIPSHKIFEDDKTVAFLDILPVSEGHLLVVPKAHSENLLEAESDDANAVLATMKKITPALKAALEADAMNVGVNCGEAAGQVVFHTHVHLMPRKTGVPRSFEKMQVSQEELAATAEKIRSRL